MADDPRSSESNPTYLQLLTEEQQVQLTEILDEYLCQVETGQAPSRDQLTADHPELASALEMYLDKLDELHRLTAPGNELTDGLEGRMLGDYQLEQEIGRGGMGIVFSAYQRDLDRRVAIKVLPMAAMLDPKFIERFRNEARATAQLEHPNIVPVYSIGDEVGIHYFAMRLIEGHSLDQRVALHNQRGTRPPLFSALRQFADVASALHAAHEYGIVHRDIKPSNLMLDVDGKLWVADFGLARFQSDQALTGTGERVGTMRYMSPEQAQGRRENVDHRTDVYSLGCTLYELLTGQPAIPGEEGPGLLHSIASHAPTRIRKIRPDLPRDLQIVIEKSMARHREDRYESAEEFAQDLRKVANGESVNTKLVSPVVLAARWTIANPRVVSVAIALFLVAWLGINLATLRVNQIIATERDQADNSLRRAHVLEAERTNAIDELALIPGVEQTRRQLMISSLQYYREYVGRPHSKRMYDDLAYAYARIGALTAELGKPSEAVDHMRQAESLYSQVDDQSRGDIQLQRQSNLNRLANTLQRVGDLDQARLVLLESVQKSRAVEDLGKLSPSLALELALHENSFGLVMQQQGRIVASEQAFDRAIAMLRELELSHPDDGRFSRALAASLHNLGSFHMMQMGRRGLPTGEQNTDSQQRVSTISAEADTARTLFAEALAIQLRLAGESHNSLQASTDLVTTYQSIGNLQLRLVQPRSAAESFAKATELARQLVEISPQVDSYRSDLAVCLSNLGMSQFQMRNYVQAEESLADSVREYRRLSELHPDHRDLRSSMGIALNNHGMVLHQLNRSGQAEDAYREAARMLDLGGIESPTAKQREALRKVYVNHVRMLESIGRTVEADNLRKRQVALAAESARVEEL